MISRSGGTRCSLKSLSLRLPSSSLVGGTGSFVRSWLTCLVFAAMIAADQPLSMVPAASACGLCLAHHDECFLGIARRSHFNHVLHIFMEGVTMKGHRIILGSALLMLAGCQTIGGESLPTLTRTGEVKDIVIRETADPASVTVNPGDEVRWVNKRQDNVKVIFLNPMTENLSCQRNFD